MAATVLIRQLNTAGETPTDQTGQTIRFGRSDTAVTASQTPIPVPASGQSYSMRVVLRPYVSSSSGSFTSINNIVWYSDGTNSLGTGRKLWYQMSGTFTTPSIPTESNDPPQLSGAMVDWFATNSGSPADGDAIAGNLTYNSTSPAAPKFIGDYLNLVFEVEAASVQGIAGPEIDHAGLVRSVIIGCRIRSSTGASSRTLRPPPGTRAATLASACRSRPAAHWSRSVRPTPRSASSPVGCWASWTG